jgi:hypothetical protein
MHAHKRSVNASTCQAVRAGLGVALLTLPAWVAAAPPSKSVACASLTTLKIADATIATAEPVEANAVIPSPMPQFGAAPARQPAHCLVRGEVGISSVAPMAVAKA